MFRVGWLKLELDPIRLDRLKLYLFFVFRRENLVFLQ